VTISMEGTVAESDSTYEVHCDPCRLEIQYALDGAVIVG
jgi:hypothetical protein